MKIFLTGGTGYIGNRIATSLAESGYEVHALIRSPRSKNLPRHKRIKLFQGDLSRKDAINEAMKGCEKVIHSAAFTNLKCNKITPFYETNVLGTENICQAALENGVDHIIYTSTLSVFGPALKNVPIVESQPRICSYANNYELTKTMSEEHIRKYAEQGFGFSILNLTRVYGPGPAGFSNGVNTLISKFMKDRLLVVPDKLHKEANYVFIDDVVNAHQLVLNNKATNQNFIIGGENCSYENLFDRIRKITKSRISMVKISYGMLKRAFALNASLGRLFGNRDALNPQVIESLFTNRTASSEKAARLLGYRKTSLDHGLELTVQHLSKIS